MISKITHKIFESIGKSIVLPAVICTCILLLITDESSGQTYTQMVEFADQKSDEGDYYYAITYYEKAMKIE